jgi:hypothetical protein
VTRKIVRLPQGAASAASRSAVRASREYARPILRAGRSHFRPGRRRPPGTPARGARDGKALHELIPVGLQERAVVARVGKHQDQRVDAAIPQLEREASLEGLQIGRSRLRFDADPPALAADMAVPRAQVADDWKRDLDPPVERAVKAPPKLAQDRHVGPVADRLACGVCTRGQFEPDDRDEPAEPDDRDVRREAALDPANLSPAQPHRATDLRLAQSTIDPRPSELGGELRDGAPSPIGTDGRGADARSHRVMMGVAGYLPVTRWCPGCSCETGGALVARAKTGGSPGSSPVAIGMPHCVQSLYDPG